MPVSGASNLEESKAVTGLTLDFTYDFRIVATNSAGTTYGTNEKFTASGKPTVETKAATSLSETGATLNGLVNPNGAETKYSFEYRTTESYGTKTAEAPLAQLPIQSGKEKPGTKQNPSHLYRGDLIAAGHQPK